VADLLVWKHPDVAPAITEREAPAFRRLRLYCWPCNGVHEFALPDVEQIIYALGMAEVEAFRLGGVIGEQTQCRELADAGPSCLRHILSAAGDADLSAEHVEQGVICRAAADTVTPGVLPAGEQLDAERRGQDADTAARRAQAAAQPDVWRQGGSPGTHGRTLYRGTEMRGVMFDGAEAAWLVGLANADAQGKDERGEVAT
jgi:hypothetical protein